MSHWTYTWRRGVTPKVSVKTLHPHFVLIGIRNTRILLLKDSLKKISIFLEDWSLPRWRWRLHETCHIDGRVSLPLIPKLNIFTHTSKINVKCFNFETIHKAIKLICEDIGNFMQDRHILGKPSQKSSRSRWHEWMNHEQRDIAICQSRTPKITPRFATSVTNHFYIAHAVRSDSLIKTTSDTLKHPISQCTMERCQTLL